MAKKWNKKSSITSALRKTWRWSPYPREAKARAKVGRGSYQCKNCQKLFSEKEIRVDHIETVVPMSWEIDDWSIYVERLFCSVEGLQILCIECHNEKTKKERHDKKIHRLNAKSLTQNPAAH